MTLLFDIEANGLQDEADTIWCIVTYDTDRGDYRVYTDFKGSLTPNGTIQEGIHELTQSDIICAHNAIGYDAPLLRRISPLFTAQFAGKIEDTYVLTQLFYPDTMPTASIEAWGRKFGLPKPGHEDWSKCSDEMIQRCLMDVKILKRVWETCQQERQSWDWEKAIALEYETYRTLVDSGQYWPINKDALDHLVEKATGEAGEALESLKKMHGGYVSGHPSNPFGEPLKPVKLHKKTYEVEDQIIAFAKDGSEWSDLGYSSLEEKGYTLTQFSYDSDWNWHSPRRGLFIKYASKSTLGITKAAQDWINKVYGPLSEHKIPTTVVGDFSRLYYHDFNPGSPPQVKDWLFKLGWKPVMKTAKGDWSTSNDPLLGIPHKEKEAFQRVKKLNKVVSAYANGLPRVAKEVNGVLSIPFSAKVCGTVTGRWTHKNLVNIPRVSSFYGKEIRSVFTHRPGYKLIGCDASALEAMLEAYEVKDIDNGARLYDVQNTDCHQKFADMAGVDRDTAKASSYALAYGAGPFKVSTMLNCSEEEAQNLFKSYHEMRWELKDYQNQLKEFLRDNKFIVKKKFKEHLKDGAYIPGIDGRKLYIRAMHKIHNSYIQSTGAILMKRAYNKLSKLIKINKLDARVIILYHDEYQIEVKDDPSTMNKVGKLAIACIEEASRFYGFPGLIKGEAKIGSNWAETH